MSLASSVAGGARASSPADSNPFDVSAAIEQAVRSELARDLHDDVVQTLAFLLMQMEDFKVRQFGRLSVQAEVSEYQSSLRETLQHMRELLYGLRSPRADASTDLVELLRDTIRLVHGRTGMRATLATSRNWPQRLPTGVAAQIQYIVQEALTNAALHSEGDRVQVRMSVQRQGDAVITVVDNGKSGTPYISERTHYGLTGMGERATAIGGTLTVERAARGGTVVRLTVPRARLQ